MQVALLSDRRGRNHSPTMRGMVLVFLQLSENGLDEFDARLVAEVFGP